MWLVVLAFVVHAVCAENATITRGNGFTVYCVGRCDNRVQRSGTLPGLVMMGGSADVDGAFQWQVSRGNGGDFVVLRASGSDGYNDYVYGMSPRPNSVTSIVITSHGGAHSQEVLDIVGGASALFFAGGDQYNYYSQWKGGLSELISQLSDTITIGGTSAGLAVQGDVVYTAARGSISSSTALANPYDRDLTLADDFLRLPRMQHLATDSHFGERDRMGRLVAFLARGYQDGYHSPSGRVWGVGVNERSAILVDETGRGRLAGTGPVYLLETSGREPEECQPNRPLTFTDVAVYRISSTSAEFDFFNWIGTGGQAYTLHANNGVLSSSGNGGSIY